MKDKNIDLKSTVREARQNALGILSKAKENVVSKTDQNNDGKFDKEDITAIANTLETKVKSNSKRLKDTAKEMERKIELKKLQPIFFEDISDSSFRLSRFIRITDRNKRYAESEVCQGAVGYLSEEKEFKFVNIFSDSLNLYNFSVYPDFSSEFYYADPGDETRYIALNEYFAYLKQERINELQLLAKALGAKHFKVTYKEESEDSDKKTSKLSFDAATLATGETARSKSNSKYSCIEIAAELYCQGHEPTIPQLKYMKNDSSVKALIDMRMDKTASLLHQKFMFKLSNSSGIKETDAIKIDAVLKGLKCSATQNIVNEVKKESQRYLEYEIDFE